MLYIYPFLNAPEADKVLVWSKASPIPGFDPAIWRRDPCGRAIRYSDHGGLGEFGWEIDHIQPRALGGPSIFSNLQPLWWKHNRLKGDTYPWACPI